MQQLIDIELEKVCLQGKKPAKRKTKNAGAVKDEWEELFEYGEKIAKKYGFIEKDIMDSIYETRYNEKPPHNFCKM